MKSKINQLHRCFVGVYNKEHNQSEMIGKNIGKCMFDDSFQRIVLNVNLPETMKIGGLTHG